MKLRISLTALWFILTFGLVWFARDLQLEALGWPFAYWWAAQGAILFFLLLVAFYAYKANKVECQEEQQNKQEMQQENKPSAM